ncbi:MAG: DUF507 family protein, partial [Nitrospirota bacterium]
MRLARERITHIAKALTRRLTEGGYIEPHMPAEELTGRIDQIITEEFMVEDRLNKEVAELLKAHEKEIETLILTGDTDTLQLVSPWVRVVLFYRIQDRKDYDEAAVMERFGGLPPKVQPDLKALMGDQSDNVP